jgi:short-subunit dehydrogenase
VGKKRTVQDVVTTAFRALERGKPYVIDGMFNYLLAQSSRFAPRGRAAMIAAGMMKPK